MLAIPLKKSDDYRNASARHLSWLSRRWLFNIPKTQQTEGIRPLGRLALVDHVNEVRSRIDDAISSILDPETVQTTADQLNLTAVTKVPNVFVVASISGGIGSGSVLDIGYLVKSILAGRNIADEHVHGILTIDGGREIGRA